MGLFENNNNHQEGNYMHHVREDSCSLTPFTCISGARVVCAAEYITLDTTNKHVSRNFPALLLLIM
jgi:hypothetical protein